MTKIFPMAIALLSFGASVGYFLNGDFKMGIYWLSATCLTLAVTL